MWRKVCSVNSEIFWQFFRRDLSWLRKSCLFKFCSNGLKKSRIDEVSVGRRFSSHIKGIVSVNEGFSIVFKKVRKSFPTNQGNFYHTKEETFSC